MKQKSSSADTKNIIALMMVRGLGIKTVSKLIEAARSTEEIFFYKASDLREITGRSLDISADLSSIREGTEFLEEMRFIEREGIRAISLLDEDYPDLLRHINDPPPVLFVKGSLPEIDTCAIAVVGSRRCSVYGINMSEKISYSLAEKGITVVSGMARGIDTAAHRGALKAKGMTVAVLGSGFSNIYPPESECLAGQISDYGAVITEYTSKVEPLKANFPRRNRIISGLSRGVVVVEAGHKSGAMITAGIALDQGREVFAVPGRVDTVFSKGTNYLIQNGAKLVADIEDILEELGPFEPLDGGVKKKTGVREDRTYKFNTDKERRVFEILSENRDCMHIDDICEKSGIEYAGLSEILLKMECCGALRSTAGKNFIL